MKLAELKQQVLSHFQVSTTKELKQIHNYDFRKKASWQYLFDEFVANDAEGITARAGKKFVTIYHDGERYIVKNQISTFKSRKRDRAIDCFIYQLGMNLELEDKTEYIDLLSKVR